MAVLGRDLRGAAARRRGFTAQYSPLGSQLDTILGVSPSGEGRIARLVDLTMGTDPATGMSVMRDPPIFYIDGYWRTDGSTSGFAYNGRATIAATKSVIFSDSLLYLGSLLARDKRVKVTAVGPLGASRAAVGEVVAYGPGRRALSRDPASWPPGRGRPGRPLRSRPRASFRSRRPHRTGRRGPGAVSHGSLELSAPANGSLDRASSAAGAGRWASWQRRPGSRGPARARSVRVRRGSRGPAAIRRGTPLRLHGRTVNGARVDPWWIVNDDYCQGR